MKDIFISYSSKDTEQTKNICRYLEEYGFRCWISYRDIKAGEDYPEIITRAIRGSKVFLILISNHSIQSEQVKKELTIANSMQKDGLKIFMVMLDDTLNPERLSDSFDYILAGIQACWWNQKSNRVDLIKQLNRIVTPKRRLPKPFISAKEKNIPSGICQNTLLKHENFIKRPYIIYITVLLLTMYGTLMIYTGSADYCELNYSNAFYYTSQHIIFTVLGMSISFWIANMSPFPLKQYIPYICILSLVLVTLLKTDLAVNDIYPDPGGLKIGTFIIRPEVPALFLFILFIAYFTEKYRKRLGKYRYLVCIWGISLVVASIFLFLGNKSDYALFILMFCLGTTFIFSNIQNVHLFIYIGFIFLITFIIAHGSESIYTWLFPDKYIAETSYIPTVLLLRDTIITCGMFGIGLSHISSIEFTHGSWNAYIFTQICERLGWIGATILLLLFIILLFQIFQIFKTAIALKDYFGSIMTFGIFLHITLAVVLNLAVQLCLVPYYLCYLPFVSYSGSSLLIFFFEIGCVLWINKNCKKTISNNHS